MQIRDKYLSNPEANPDKSKSAIPAMDVTSRALYCWLVAMDLFEKVLRGSAPKRESLARAESEHQVRFRIRMINLKFRIDAKSSING